ncbi:MAG: SET domain-containing protein-lysine N-methyltransferase [Gammaproteobacteria bacterium]
MSEADRVVVRPSAKGGWGSFARVVFSPDERIRERFVVREVTDDHPLSPTDNPEHAFRADGRMWLAGPPDCYLNHSCDPNAYIEYTGEHIHLIARRAIEVGDEITLDYLINNEGGSSWPCACGAPRCRGETGVSFFHLPEAVQREYFPLLAPWFRRRHADRLARLTD